MNINEAIKIIGDKHPIVRQAAEEALVDNNSKIEFVNYILDQYHETYEQHDRITRLFGEEVMLCIVKWARKEALRQDYFVMNECIKEDLK